MTTCSKLSPWYFNHNAYKLNINNIFVTLRLNVKYSVDNGNYMHIYDILNCLMFVHLWNIVVQELHLSVEFERVITDWWLKWGLLLSDVNGCCKIPFVWCFMEVSFRNSTWSVQIVKVAHRLVVKNEVYFDQMWTLVVKCPMVELNYPKTSSKCSDCEGRSQIGGQKWGLI